MTNQKFQSIIKEPFIRCRKPNISLVFITQSYFSVPKDVRLNSTHYLIMKINNRKELQNIAINDSADIDYKDFIKIYRECTKEPYSFLTINTKLSSSNPLRFRQICLILYKQWQYLKVEYLTGEDLGLEPSTIEEAKFEYSPLGKILIKD